MRFRKNIVIPSLLLAAAGLLFVTLLIPVNPERLYRRVGFSYRFYDRYGKLLHAGLSSNGFLYEPVDISKIPVHTVAALVLLEDRRFFSHAGIDLKAVGRALWNRLASSGSSGASTLTMQLARNIFNWPRNIFAKLGETWFALRLEQTFSKQQILEHYFNTIPFGSRIIGIQTASRRYFGRPVEKLSPAQGAYLAALVKFPAYSGSAAHKQEVKKRQLQALGLLKEDGVLSSGQYRRALREQVKVLHSAQHRIAPHFTDLLLKQIRRTFPEQLDRIIAIHTTLDLAAQLDCRKKAAAAVQGLTNKRISNAAVVLLDSAGAELRALVGSVDYYSSRAGQVNGTAAVRSPGSSLKPFIYAAALERGTATAADPIADVKTDFYSRGGDYNPENYSRTYHGPVSFREALACSYNIPAVKILQRTGTVQVLQDLRTLGFDSLDKDADWYGLTLALGGGNVSLLELTAAYRALAEKGVYRPIKMIKRIETRSGVDLELPDHPFVRVYSAATAFIIGDILADNRARQAAFTAHSPLRMPFFCAVKTGTSKGFRDNWTAGYSRNWTLGVWVGNFDNTPMEGVSGISGAAPLFRQIMLARENDYDWRPPVPSEVVKKKVCTTSGKVPGDSCPGSREEWFGTNRVPTNRCPFHWKVPYRSDGSIVWTAKKKLPVQGVKADWQAVELLPEQYHGWLKMTGRGVPALQLVKYVEWLRSGRRPVPVRPVVKFPDSGDIFAVDPILSRQQQKLTLRAEISAAPQQVYWVFNATNRIKVDYPWTVQWQIRRGNWSLQVECVWNGTNRLRSKPVYFQVY